MPPPAEIDRFVYSIRDAGLKLNLLNLTEGVPSHGGRGLAGVPSAGDEFWRNCESVLSVVERTGTAYVNVLAGCCVDGDRQRGVDTLVERLAVLASSAADVGAGLVLEHLNPTDHPHYLLPRASDALEVVEAARALSGKGRIGMLADLYHLSRSGTDVVDFFDRHTSMVHYVQVADSPGRGVPGTGSVPIGEAIAVACERGYTGAIGIECLPAATGVDVPTPTQMWELIRETSFGSRDRSPPNRRG